MNEEQIKELLQWLQAQAYSGECGTDGPYLRMEEMVQYLPAELQKILKGEKDTNKRTPT